MRGFSGVGPLIWQRLVASWRLLAVLAFGILVAATLLAASPVYTRVMNDLGLESSLSQQIGSANRNAFTRFDLPFGTPEGAAESRSLATLFSDELSWLTASEVRYGGLVNLRLSIDGRPLANNTPTLVFLQTSSGLDDHVQLVEGRLAQPSNDPTRIEALLPVLAAREIGARVGDTLIAAQPFDDCAALPPPADPEEARDRARFRCLPSASTVLQAPVTVVGFVDQTDRDDPYWRAGSLSFTRPVATEFSPPIVTLILPERSFYEALPFHLPGVPSLYRLTSFADIGRLTSANLDSTRATLERLREQLQQRGAVPDLAMALPLNEFNMRASFNQVPLLILLLQVVGIAVYYVLLVSSLLAERRAEETAMLRSRGASVGQVLALAAGEAVCLALAAALVAPFLASAVVAALGKTGTFDPVSHGDFLPFTLVPASFLYALGGAAIAALAVIVPAFFAARRGMVLFLHAAARPGKPLLQRYYLDLALAGLAALGLWEMNQRGSVFDPRSVGGWSADPLLLVSPLLLITATGALMFRFLPPLLSLISRLVAATAGPGVTLGLWQLTRSPARYTQLALLVVMAAAVGVFAATYGETTDRSQEDRALYEAGADVRITGLSDLSRISGEEASGELAKVSGVEGAATVYRGSFSLGPMPNPNAQRVPILGIDPQAAPPLLWFRDDFADEDLGALLRRVAGSSAGGSGLVLQGEPVAVSVWANPSPPRPGLTLWLRTVDANGVFRLHDFGRLDFEGYRRLETRFSRERDGITYPLSVLGLEMTQAQSINDVPGGLVLDDIVSIDADGQETEVEDFEGAFRWDAVRSATRNRDAVRQVGGAAHGGNGAAQYAFRIGAAVPVRGMFFTDPNVPLPAIASKRFMDRTGAQLGGEVELVLGSTVVPLSIQGVARFFPTLGDADPGFLIVNQRHLYFYALMLGESAPTGPNEAWLRLGPHPAERAAVFAALRDKFRIQPSQIVDSVKVLEDVRTDPIVRAGGSGVLLIALIAAFSILALGFVLTLYLGGQARSVEVSVMRAVGLSPGQIFAMISLEYLLVAAIGLVIGTIAGLRISETMLSFLNLTETGARVVPPFSLATRWDTVAVAFVATALAFLAGVAGLALYFLRLPVSRILRLTR